MASIASLGIGSGLDVNSIVTKLVDLEKQPLTSLKAKAAVITAQVSTYGDIKSQIASVSDAALNLGSPSFWKKMTATSSNSAAVSATVTGISSPQSSYSVEVQQLARAQNNSSQAFVANASVGTGSLSIQVGTWSSGFGGFTPGATSAVTINIGAGEDSLSSIATKINDANAGVTASIVKDSSGERLSIRSKATGEAAGFRIQTADSDLIHNDNNGLSRLAFDPQSGSFGMATTIATAQQARDAKATLNGVPVTSTTNTFSELIPGVQLTVNQVTTMPLDVNVTSDTTTIKKAITDFVAAYNKLNTTLTNATKYDASTKKGAILQGDSATIGLQNALRSLVGSTTTGAAYSRLSDIGITVQRDGSLMVGDVVNGTSLSSGKLDAALQNISGLRDFFTVDNKDQAINGFGLKLKKFTIGMLASDGALKGKTDSLESMSKTNQKEQDKVNTHASLVQARLTAQYSALDGKMASMNALSSYVSQQVTTWNKNTA